MFEDAVDALNADYATALTDLHFTNADIPKLNLSLNHELQVLVFDNATIHELILPQDHAIRTLAITASELWPNTQQVDYVISNIYANSVAGSRFDGSATLYNCPISTESARMLEELRTSYRWDVQY